MNTDTKPIATIGLDAQLIRKRIESMEVGEIVSYSDLEEITKRPLNELRGSFYTAARQVFREFGWTFGPVKGVGYKRLDAAEKLDTVEGKRKHIHKTARRAGAVLASIKVSELPQEQQVRHNLEVSFAGAIALATGKKATRLIAEKAASAPLPGIEVLSLFAK